MIGVLATSSTIADNLIDQLPGRSFLTSGIANCITDESCQTEDILLLPNVASFLRKQKEAIAQVAMKKKSMESDDECFYD